MITSHTAETLIAFEQQIAEDFNSGKIRAPVHLAGGNEEQLLKIFADVGESDWVFTQWRSHYHCLLRGVPPTQLRADVLAGRSITLCYPEHRVLSSAIVGGILPIATGVALAIRRSGGRERVWVFVGDMTSRTGMFHECARYSCNFDLPIQFVVEDNDRSVYTSTREAWGVSAPQQAGGSFRRALEQVTHYRYELPWPHAGAGRRVEF